MGKKLLLLLLITLTLKGQDKIHSYSGITNFEASIPLFEEVKAVNKKTTCTLSTKNGEIKCWLSVKDFEFKRNLMKEHFNTTYLESDRHPKALFKGVIENFDLNTITTISVMHQIKGNITLKGITKNIAIQGSLRKVRDGLEFVAKFPIHTDDFQIEIPLIIRKQISKTVTTQISCVFK